MSTKAGWKLRPETAMMSLGHDRFLSEGAVVMPIYKTTTYAVESFDDGEERFSHPAQDSTLLYSRINNPNCQVFEERLAYCEGGEACASFASGMAAIFALCFEFLKPGDVLMFSELLYGGTASLFNALLPEKMGIKTVGFNNENFQEKLKQVALSHKIPKLIFIETPGNPTNVMIDIEMCRRLTSKYLLPGLQPIIVVDNTFLGPIFQYPLKLGADISVYSATKYIGGHSDVVAGACVGSREHMNRLKRARMNLGSILNPESAYMCARGLQTLSERMTKQIDNACIMAEYLANHPKVEKVYHPSVLKVTDSDYAIYKRQCLAPGAIVSFDIKGGTKSSKKFLDSLKIFVQAVSLGSVESLAQHPHTMTHRGVSDEDKNRLGITDKMIRLAIGKEHPDDLVKDLEQSLSDV
ncbi:MAG: hypothetical protein A3D92_18705 [Bacteroidetes bacterium RIFCSPHIGHO2_02_FULL_44_7]|nr:MAG: hypothetical protein A3D92_18705 [Bacteroidetes bacterium RIFCSPHIGHO2_02_FULL_44_7]